mmetsp:Transcript_37551/g.120699  ORF Transcript_37551/g.120699 Transcript_37551/m.120699 type:complete len:277 (-) Transcript_37551:313-1143(-)
MECDKLGTSPHLYDARHASPRHGLNRKALAINTTVPSGALRPKTRSKVGAGAPVRKNNHSVEVWLRIVFFLTSAAGGRKQRPAEASRRSRFLFTPRAPGRPLRWPTAAALRAEAKGARNAVAALCAQPVVAACSRQPGDARFGATVPLARLRTAVWAELPSLRHCLVAASAHPRCRRFGCTRRQPACGAKEEADWARLAAVAVPLRGHRRRRLAARHAGVRLAARRAELEAGGHRAVPVDVGVVLPAARAADPVAVLSPSRRRGGRLLLRRHLGLG